MKRSNVSTAFKKLIDCNIVIKEQIEYTKSYRYRINYELCAKDKGSEIKEKQKTDKNQNPMQTSILDEDQEQTQ
jgi:predicted transcriptional regulator